MSEVNFDLIKQKQKLKRDYCLSGITQRYKILKEIDGKLDSDIENQPLLKTIFGTSDHIKKDMLVLEQNCNFKAVDNATQPQKPHWEPVTLGARAGLSTSLTSFQIGKTEIHIGHQNPKNRVVFAKKPKTRC